MKKTLKNIIQKDDNNYGLEIWNQNFSNEIIFGIKIFTGIIDEVTFLDCQFTEVHFLSSSFRHCTFIRCKFEGVLFSKSEFCDSIFENCQIIHSEAAKTDFQETIFKNCEFKHVDFGWSYFASCQFLEIRLDEINFEGTIISDLKAKNTTSLNLHFHEKFPMKFWKCNQPIKIKDFSSFDKLLRDSQLD